MVIEYPNREEVTALKQLWHLAFGDTEEFLDSFYSSGFSPERCRIIRDGAQICAMLYWFDCSCRDQKIAYLYGVATHPEYRNRGLCRTLMKNTHALLREKGYAAAVLVPQQEPLRKMYAFMGYEDMGRVSFLNCLPSEQSLSPAAIDGSEYARLRQQYLPEGSVIQEGANLAFLETVYELYAGRDYLLAAYREEGFLWGMEFLGTPSAVPGILKALNCTKGRLRTPGEDHPFAMYLPLDADAQKPTVFGLAFD